MAGVMKQLYEDGKYQEVLDQFMGMENRSEMVALPEEEQIECLYYKSCSLALLGRYGEAHRTVTAARETYTSPENKSYQLALLVAHYRVLSEWRRELTDEARELVEEGKGIVEALMGEENRIGAYWVAKFEEVKGFAYHWSNYELDKALECYQRALRSFEALDSIHDIADCLLRIATIYYFKNELNTALECTQRSMNLYQSLNNKNGIAESLLISGNAYSAKGELDTALDYYQRGLKFAEESNCPKLIAYALIHASRVYSAKGDPDKALEYLKRPLVIVESLGYEHLVAYTLIHSGMVYYQKGALDEALDSFQRGLSLQEAQNRDFEIARALYHLVRLSLDRQELEHASKYLIYLQEVAARIPDESPSTHLRSRLAEALVLKQSPRMAKKVQAQGILTQIVNEELGLDLTLEAIVALCDLLLFELKSTGDPGTWEEVNALVDKLYSRARDGKRSGMTVNALLLRAKFATIDGKLSRATELFNQAGSIAREKNLGLLASRVEAEQEKFESEFVKWQELIDWNVSLKERLDRAQLEEYIQEARKEVERMM